jgi:hypothetical protein
MNTDRKPCSYIQYFRPVPLALDSGETLQGSVFCQLAVVRPLGSTVVSVYTLSNVADKLTKIRDENQSMDSPLYILT